MAMSPRHFARVFHAELGVTPARFVEGLRIEAARRWLERGEHSVDSVAAACGLGASERLRRAFLRRLGVNPRDYQSHFESAPASLSQARSKP
jgi:transcriptional regulator GlxA family with amidase domain